jgi:hypothetical protein
LTRLNQVIAIEKGAKGRADSTLMQADRRMKAPALLTGLSRTYSPRDDDGEQLPSESTKVQLQVEEVLAEVRAVMVDLFDITATKDWGNCHALADVVVGGETLLEQVPVTYLLFLEKQLTHVHTFVARLPTLDPAEEWQYDKSTGLQKTAPRQTTRSKKVPRSQTLYEATPEHPAQVHMYHEDVVVGTWTLTAFSGAIHATRVRELLRRIEALQRAVKMAREQANVIEVTRQEVGQKIFDHIFGSG